MAAYGWPIHVYLNPVRGPISLCKNASCKCCCAQCQEPQFEGNQCFPHQAAIKAMTGTEVDDIIDASFVNLVHIVPFYVVKVDNDERKELIIAVRGTLSIKVSEIFGVITQTCHIRNDNCNCHDVLYTYNVTKYLATLQYASVLQNNYDIMSVIGLGNNTSINTDKQTTTDRNQQ